MIKGQYALAFFWVSFHLFAVLLWNFSLAQSIQLFKYIWNSSDNFLNDVATIIARVRKSIISWIIPFIFLLNHGVSLPSQFNISCGIMLFIILRIMLLKTLTFSLTLVLEKALVQLNPLLAFRRSSILASL